LIGVTRPAVTIRGNPDPETMLAICRGAFAHDRFHRDFNVPRPKADLRYEKWLADLLVAGRVLGLYHEGAPAGFIAHKDGKLVLHALAPAFRGRGLARPFWSLACADLFAQGYNEITSSISLGNMPALNLYASLGFRFRNPRDLYHLYNPTSDTGDG
jgi:ribosomal protein S18 acetylase RimI-like enzyme